MAGNVCVGHIDAAALAAPPPADDDTAASWRPYLVPVRHAGGACRVPALVLRLTSPPELYRLLVDALRGNIAAPLLDTHDLCLRLTRFPSEKHRGREQWNLVPARRHRMLVECRVADAVERDAAFVTHTLLRLPPAADFRRDVFDAARLSIATAADEDDSLSDFCPPDEQLARELDTFARTGDRASYAPHAAGAAWEASWRAREEVGLAVAHALAAAPALWLRHGDQVLFRLGAHRIMVRPRRWAHAPHRPTTDTYLLLWNEERTAREQPICALDSLQYAEALLRDSGALGADQPLADHLLLDADHRPLLLDAFSLDRQRAYTWRQFWAELARAAPPEPDLAVPPPPPERVFNIAVAAQPDAPPAKRARPTEGGKAPAKLRELQPRETHPQAHLFPAAAVHPQARLFAAAHERRQALQRERAELRRSRELEMRQVSLAERIYNNLNNACTSRYHALVQRAPHQDAELGYGSNRDEMRAVAEQMSRELLASPTAESPRPQLDDADTLRALWNCYAAKHPQLARTLGHDTLSAVSLFALLQGYTDALAAQARAEQMQAVLDRTARELETVKDNLDRAVHEAVERTRQEAIDAIRGLTHSKHQQQQQQSAPAQLLL